MRVANLVSDRGAGAHRGTFLYGFCLHRGGDLILCVCVCVCVWQEWDRKAEDARREYEKAMKEYEGGRGESSKR